MEPRIEVKHLNWCRYCGTWKVLPPSNVGRGWMCCASCSGRRQRIRERVLHYDTWHAKKLKQHLLATYRKARYPNRWAVPGQIDGLVRYLDNLDPWYVYETEIADLLPVTTIPAVDHFSSFQDGVSPIHDGGTFSYEICAQEDSFRIPWVP